MTKTKIFQLALIPIILLLGWLLFDGIKSEIDKAENIAKSEALVIARLKMIRDAQKAYFEVHTKYASSWDSLFHFINHGKMYNISRKERIVMSSMDRNPKDPKYGLEDSVVVTYDTLGIIDAKTAIFPPDKYPDLKVEELKYVPDYKGLTTKLYEERLKAEGKTRPEFELYAAQKTVNGVPVSYVEVKDPYPLDKTRKDDNQIARRRLLRFGSREEVTISGNWE
ncbi:MAG: hypothetical protein NZM38_08850 [Cytophagales bacterium]|nr:hypothetical protein [Cytophagales bacterium]MDW8384867.1 hypothetical protein [Flammeovirgaceae bacterium]